MPHKGQKVHFSDRPFKCLSAYPILFGSDSVLLSDRRLRDRSLIMGWGASGVLPLQKGGGRECFCHAEGGGGLTVLG